MQILFVTLAFGLLREGASPPLATNEPCEGEALRRATIAPPTGAAQVRVAAAASSSYQPGKVREIQALNSTMAVGAGRLVGPPARWPCGAFVRCGQTTWHR